MENNRFVIQKSELKPGYWVCTDTENLIICTFENKNFNDNQEFKELENFDPAKYMQLAKIVREMSDWLRENHYEKIF